MCGSGGLGTAEGAADVGLPAGREEPGQPDGAFGRGLYSSACFLCNGCMHVVFCMCVGGGGSKTDVIFVVVIEKCVIFLRTQANDIIMLNTMRQYVPLEVLDVLFNIYI